MWVCFVLLGVCVVFAHATSVSDFEVAPISTHGATDTEVTPIYNVSTLDGLFLTRLILSRDYETVSSQAEIDWQKLWLGKSSDKGGTKKGNMFRLSMCVWEVSGSVGVTSCSPSVCVYGVHDCVFECTWTQRIRWVIFHSKNH
jgi:hypothetical protein